MKTLLPALALLCATAWGCSTEHCDDVRPADMKGRYYFPSDAAQSAPSGARLVSATLDADDGQVVVTYQNESGQQFRARYRVTRETVRR